MVTREKELEINIHDLPIVGNIIAENVLYDLFLDTDYGDVHVEWVHGKVVEVAGGASPLHNKIVNYLYLLFRLFIDRTIKGEIYTDPTLMCVVSVGVSRAPDIQYLSANNPLPMLKKNKSLVSQIWS